MLFDMIKEAEQKAGVTPPVPEPCRLEAADEEVMQNFVDRIRQQILAEIAAESIEAAGTDCRFRAATYSTGLPRNDEEPAGKRTRVAARRRFR
jgi:DNA-binding IscR family transcriptional regulator